ncbi:TetR/AcrR family transcriptional regulator [Brevibacterium aurantiacum]|uniref:TetR/AcrR family transcriptional regulator n=1 Tax=Brevibacterium aurantiacum TaxID=273384 RepID=A0A556CDR4_BREAU|nr:TetR/AcrR family transcriptional regulator [Brevibacterium aurantiacum]
MECGYYQDVATTQAVQKSARSRRGTGTYDERRIKLAESALRTLGELGYARTSLRDIAANSEFSHGVVHYYFRDKTELIVFCVRHYKTQCMHRYDSVVEESTSSDGLLTGFADKLVQTLTEEPSMHRLWYDLRSQSMFQEELRDDVHDIDQGLEDMIWRVVSRYAELSSTSPMVESRAAYSMFDGIFESTLRDFLADRPGAVDWIRTQVMTLLPGLCAPVETTPR